MTDYKRCFIALKSTKTYPACLIVSLPLNILYFERPAQIKGMEEGMHSMRVGGKRRVIMPQGLGYTVQGLGPYPADPRKRDILVKVKHISPPRDALVRGGTSFDRSQKCHSYP